ncbi:class F sortase [Actinosynnema sp. NPDC020468]|uniref:class F sortase n=1 Tax=Actinosynnema sp. NPDC020468 TaxID=3154488 RepID=UPI0033D24C38
MDGTVLGAEVVEGTDRAEVGADDGSTAAAPGGEQDEGSAGGGPGGRGARVGGVSGPSSLAESEDHTGRQAEGDSAEPGDRDGLGDSSTEEDSDEGAGSSDVDSAKPASRGGWARPFLTGVVVASALAGVVTFGEVPVVRVAGSGEPAVAAVPWPLGDSARGGVRLGGVPGGFNPPVTPVVPSPTGVPATPVPPPPPPPPAAQPPGTVRLPGGGLATLVRMEVTDGGVLPVPDGVGEAAWWGVDLASAEGATVLAGHVDWKGVTGPFEELWRTAVGQDVVVVDAGGAARGFVVEQVRAVRKDELPGLAPDLFGPRGPHRLVLVTCGGRWVGGQRGYEENRVVVATPRP